MLLIRVSKPRFVFLDTHACVGEFGVLPGHLQRLGSQGGRLAIFLAISEFHKRITGGLHLAASEHKTDVSCTPLSTLTQVQGSEAIMSDFILSSGSILLFQ